jgi:basic membrane lipoprotein Med (substrate-binding protein (PBP1-ABC) superfamily)
VRKSKYFITAILLISITATTLLVGCAGQKTTSTVPSRVYSIVKVTEITDLQGVKWENYQLRLTLEGGATFPIDLNLANGNVVSCWYTTEKPASGGSVNFQVEAGTSVIYPTGTTGTGAVGNTSDKLTFTATTANGTSYRLVFHNNLTDISSKETIYTEINYPANASGEDSIFIPLQTN